MTLPELIQAWLDANPEHSVGVLARRGGISRNNVYRILSPAEPPFMPRDRTLAGIATGIGEPLRVVKDAAAQWAGYRVTSELDPESQEIQAWIALLEDLPEQRRTELWEIGRMYLRRAKDDT